MRDYLKRHLKRRYGNIAKNGGSCCQRLGTETGCGCELGASMGTGALAQTMGYSERDLQRAPTESWMGLGCGNPVPLAGICEGEVVLDLGSGGGIDAFLAAERTGKRGKVIGVDMTEEMVERARSLAEKYGYGNIEFRLGEIENLPVEDGSVDVVISNCVINLALDKRRVFREVYRVLRPGGRLVVSDIVTDVKLPDEVKRDADAWSACIAGASRKEEYLNLIEGAGFAEVRVLSESKHAALPQGYPAAALSSVQVTATKPNIQ